MQMNGMAELITVAKYHRQWPDQRLIFMVLNNGDLNQVTWEQRVMNGDPKFEGSQSLPAVDYARFAELIGLRGIRVEDPAAVGLAWEEALASEKPTVLDVVTDPEVPPLPPHITLEQAKAFAAAVFGGDPAAGRMIAQSLRQKVAEALPGK
jgi:pyruvate dehydrogenase (quinone)